MKIFHYFIGILCTFALMITIFITSIEAVVYWTPGYYAQEYEKYEVAEAVSMEMDDLLDVTHEMMAYLKGNRIDLHVPTIVNGQPREFFNEREIAHMEDVRDLFLGAINIRRACVITLLLGLGLLLLLKANLKRIIPRTICGGTILFFGGMAFLAGIIATDFSKYFIIFHKIFFNNDLWILDPTTDLLINIVPEPFFVDTATRIGITFGSSVLVVLLLSIFFLFYYKKKGNPMM